MALDDLLKGLKTFEEGVLAMEQANSIREARSVQLENEKRIFDGQLKLKNQLSHGVIDMRDYQQGLSDLQDQKLQNDTIASQGLQARLMALGMNAGDVQQATSFAPSASAQFQANVNKKLQADSQKFNANQKALDRKENRWETLFKAGIDLAKIDEKKKSIDLGGGLVYHGAGQMDQVLARQTVKEVGQYSKLVQGLQDTVKFLEKNGVESWGKDAEIAKSLDFLNVTAIADSMVQAGVLQKHDIEFIKEGVGGAYSGWFNTGSYSRDKVINKLSTILDRARQNIKTDLVLRNVHIAPNSFLSTHLGEVNEGGQQTVGSMLKQGADREYPTAPKGVVAPQEKVSEAIQSYLKRNAKQVKANPVIREMLADMEAIYPTADNTQIEMMNNILRNQGMSFRFPKKEK